MPTANWYYRKSTLLEAALIARGGMDKAEIMQEFGCTEWVFYWLMNDIRKRRRVLTLTRPTRYEIIDS